MIFGTRFLMYSNDAVADHAFLRDTIGFKSVDAGDGWLIFALPPSEVAVHPGAPEGHELYLLTDDVHQEIKSLARKGITCSEVQEQPWGSHTAIKLPGGG